MRYINPLLLKTKYRNRSQYSISFHGIPTIFSTTDSHSKSWFYPRYDHGRVHEPAVTYSLVEEFKKAEVFFDVGTHLGFYTCIAGKMMPMGQVVGFEMDVLSFQLLEENVRLNQLDNVTIHNTAVVAMPGTVRYPTNTTPNAGLSIQTDITTKNNCIEVAATSIDSYCEENTLTPDLIKIDVEGAEIQVLKGMANTLRQYPKLYIELHENLLPNFDSSIQEVITLLHDAGYQTYEIIEHRKNSRGALRPITFDSLPKGNPMIIASQKAH